VLRSVCLSVPYHATQMSRESKTTSRTYTDHDGNVITGVCDYSSHSGALCTAAFCTSVCPSHAMERSPPTQMNCESKTTLRTYSDFEGSIITGVCDYSSHSGALCTAAFCTSVCPSHAMERSPATQMSCESKTVSRTYTNSKGVVITEV